MNLRQQAVAVFFGSTVFMIGLLYEMVIAPSVITLFFIEFFAAMMLTTITTVIVADIIDRLQNGPNDEDY